MNKFLAAILVSASMNIWANDGIVGKWQTIDDETKQAKSIIEISKQGDIYKGKIIALLQNPNFICNKCTGEFKDKSIIGMPVLTGLKYKDNQKDNQYEDGKIFDPQNGKTYSAKAKLIENGQKLEVRGFMGISLLGRTQTWNRTY